MLTYNINHGSILGGTKSGRVKIISDILKTPYVFYDNDAIVNKLAVEDITHFSKNLDTFWPQFIPPVRYVNSVMVTVTDLLRVGMTGGLKLGVVLALLLLWVL